MEDLAVQPPVSPIMSPATVVENTQTSSEASPGVLQKPSYSSIVQNRPTLSRHEFSVTMVNGDPIVQVPNEIFEDSTPLWEDLLIGRFPQTAPHVAKVHVIVNKIWPLGDKTVKIDAFAADAKTIKFRIRDSSVRARVLRRGMWNIADMPMIVSKWSPVIEDAQPEIKSMPMWITIKNVPRSMFTWKGLSFLASPVGEPKKLHPDTVLCNSFEEAKIFVEADLLKNLPKQFRFKSETGVDAMVEYKYPWLPPRCSSCSKWGHLQDVCLTRNPPSQHSKVVEKETGEEPEPIVILQKESQQTTLLESSSTSNQMEGKKDGIQNQNVSDLQTKGKDIVDGTMEKKNDEDTWHSVSPAKVGRQRGPKNHEVQDIHDHVSPSRFTVLAVEDDKVETASREEGEIVTTTQSHEISDTLELVGTQGTRPSIPRTSKSKHKVINGSGNQNTKGNPSVSGHRVPRKK